MNLSIAMYGTNDPCRLSRREKLNRELVSELAHARNQALKRGGRASRIGRHGLCEMLYRSPIVRLRAVLTTPSLPPF